MSQPGAFPPYFINKVIDELGEAFNQPGSWYGSRRVDRNPNYAALRACSLVSKRWTPRSRAHIFKTVKIRGDKKPNAPPSVLPYVKELELYGDWGPAKTASIAEVFKAFPTSPIESLVINGAVLADERPCILEFLGAHYGTLQKLELACCSISPQNISEIVLGRHHPRSLYLNTCKPAEQLGKPTDKPESDIHSKISEMELCISGEDPFEGAADIVDMVAKLPHRFSKLDIEHLVAGEGTTWATNTLLRANGGELSSLRVRIWAGMFEPSGREMFLICIVSQRTWRSKSGQSTCSVLSTARTYPS
jgi:hypothetical protein